MRGIESTYAGKDEDILHELDELVDVHLLNHLVYPAVTKGRVGYTTIEKEDLDTYLIPCLSSVVGLYFDFFWLATVGL